MSALSLKTSNDQELAQTRKGILEDLAECQADLALVEEEMRLRGLIANDPEASRCEVEAAAHALAIRNGLRWPLMSEPGRDWIRDDARAALNAAAEVGDSR